MLQMSSFLPKLAGGFVLAFHQIPPDKFVNLLNYLEGFEPVHLDELLARSEQGKSNSGLFAITVDDGVGDNVRSLVKMLCTRKWPATFYIPTEYVDTHLGMAFQWWRNVQRLIPQKAIPLKRGLLDLSRPGALEQWSYHIDTLLHTSRRELYAPVIMELVDYVAREQGSDRSAFAPSEPITWTEVAQLSKNDLVRFESHGVTHTAMCALSEQELEFELKLSRDLISEHTGRLCRHLAYPFGSRRSIGSLVPVYAKKFYSSATTMILGPVTNANHWFLPRIPIYARNSPVFATAKVILSGNTLTASVSDQISTARADWRARGIGQDLPKLFG